ncbi:HAMP domain-containing protein, partial [Methanospirillum sp.]|uniref:HAMP domain-containing protein n=1 Tax=Methanospirillum sp. TaxID=45200 RepID=UPI002D1FA9FA
MTESPNRSALTIIEEMIENGGDIPENLPGSPEEQEQLRHILEKIAEMHSFVSRMSEGDLDARLSFRGYLAGPLKALQSSLRHLTWQAKMIAEGDLTQRVDFMGEFSLSFNQMVTNLADNRDQLISRKEELERSYAALSQANNKLNILSSITRHDILNHVMVIINYCFLL